MIFDKWENLQKYSFSPEWNTIIRELCVLRDELFNTLFHNDYNTKASQDFLDAFVEKSYPLPHNAFVNTMAFFPKEENTYEAHRKFVDIHFVIHGNERIDIASTTDIIAKKAYNDSDIYNQEKDFIFFTKPYKADACVYMDNSNFLLAMPEDAHATCLKVQQFVIPEAVPKTFNCNQVTVKGIVKIPVQYCL